MQNISEQEKLWAKEVWEKINNKMKVIASKNQDAIPYSTGRDGSFDNCAEKSWPYDISWWTNGFWPGYMWLLYVGTGEEIYRKVAEKSEKMLDDAFVEYDHLHHDVGFMWHISAGASYKITGNKSSRLRALYAADILAGRYNPRGKYVRSWNNDSDTDGYHKLIIDSMMNIPLLYWASEEHCDDRYKKMAVNHADTIIQTHIREDNKSNHIVEVDPEDGSPVKVLAGQGYEVGSAWTRGQAWAIYGFILSYIHTGIKRYLETAEKVAESFLECCESYDFIVPIDFCQPSEPKLYDTSAASCAACGLIEISKHCSEEKSSRYLLGAIKLLKKIDEKAADYTLNCDNLVGYASEAYRPGRGEAGHNIPIIYGDYFYAEAIYKLNGFEILLW